MMVKNILVLGAGLSATSLITYLLNNASKYDWQITVVDLDLTLAQSKISGNANAKALSANLSNTDEIDKLIENQNIAISMLPAFMHYKVGLACLKHNCHLFNASYVSNEMETLHEEAVKKNLLFMCELGADPGLDHISIVHFLNEFKEKNITGFKSLTGALIAPECLLNNPLKYKFTWSPLNVINAGSGGADYIANYQIQSLDYLQTFEQARPLKVKGIDDLCYYINRYSSQYLSKYDCHLLPNFERGTIRYTQFVSFWTKLIKLNLTLSQNKFDTNSISLFSWLQNELSTNLSPREFFKNTFQLDEDSHDIKIWDWLDIDKNVCINIGEKTSQLILLHVLENKLGLEKNDRDMLLMHHIVEYEENFRKRRKTFTLKIFGGEQTAISQTVGLPLAIFTKLFCNNQVEIPFGVQIPNFPALSAPILKELADYGIFFEFNEYAAE